MPKKISVARAITQLDRAHIIHLFRTAKKLYKANGIELRGTSRKASMSKILIVTPRSCGSAVERNRIRRRIKAIFYQEKLYERPLDLLLFVHPEAHQLSYDELREVLCSAAPSA